jgi:hypothetical protein
MYLDPFTDSPFAFPTFWSEISEPVPTTTTTSKKRKFTATVTDTPLTPSRGSFGDLLHAHSSMISGNPSQRNSDPRPHAPSLELLNEYYCNVPDALKGQLILQYQIH